MLYNGPISLEKEKESKKACQGTLRPVRNLPDLVVITQILINSFKSQMVERYWDQVIKL